jgi:Replicative DNA helicase
MNEVKEQLKSVQSENHVISHLLNYPKSYLGIKGPITTKDFTSYNNRKIFEAIGAIFESGNEVTELSVCQKLKDSGVSFNGGVDDYVEAIVFKRCKKGPCFKQA